MFEQFSESFSSLINKMQGWIDSIVLALPNIVLASIVLGVSIFFARYFKKIVTNGLYRTTNNKTVVGVISNISVAAFMIVSLFVILNILNLSEAVTALLGTAGVIGLAVGLALQDPLINLFSGVLMSVKDYYQVGDLIETNGYFGKIQKITLRSTVIAQPDGQEVIIPNKEVLQNPLKNFSHNGRRRIELDCGVAYGDDLESVEKIAVNAIENSGLSIREVNPIEFYFMEFGDSSINFRIRFWKNITSQKDYFAARHVAIKAIKKAFDENGFTIPFPITTLDFGVVGGVRVDDIYPPQKMKIMNGSKNGKMNGTKSESANIS